VAAIAASALDPAKLRIEYSMAMADVEAVWDEQWRAHKPPARLRLADEGANDCCCDELAGVYPPSG
jgi:hypothetical protein